MVISPQEEETILKKKNMLFKIVSVIERLKFFHWLGQFFWMITPLVVLITFCLKNNSFQGVTLPLFIISFGFQANMILATMIIPPVTGYLWRNGVHILKNEKLNPPKLMPLLILALIVKLTYLVYVSIYYDMSWPGLVFYGIDMTYYTILLLIFGSSFGAFENEIYQAKLESISSDKISNILNHFR